MTPEFYLSKILPWCEGEKREREIYNCVDCQLSTLKMNHYYHVHDDIWERAGNPKGCLCFPCLEQRILRPLSPIDFDSAPVNMMSALHSDSAALRIFGKNFLSIRPLVVRWFEDYFRVCEVMYGMSRPQQSL